ncbi:MAG: twin-arginine translocation signal domain-containing protein [Coriobacteriia bacterium]|nr:twin-arginine translocation signal domain-containing protein [Coriobacteriia bacterium]
MDSPKINRRDFLKAGLGLGAAALGVGAAAELAACGGPASSAAATGDAAVITDSSTDAGLTTIAVSTDQLIDGTGFTEVPLETYLVQSASYQLPRGCLLYQATPSTALVLAPAGEGKELVYFALLDLDTGKMEDILHGSVGASAATTAAAAAATAATPSSTATAAAATPTSAAFADAILYDARASESALVWTEFDLSSQAWQVYAASLSGAALGDPTLLDQGTSDYEVPKLCVSGAKVYWQVMPNASGAAQYQNSYLKAAVLGAQAPYIVYTSHGRMSTQPLASGKVLSFVPRVDSKNVYYRLAALSVDDDQPVASEIMPQSMKVSDAIYLDPGFAFGIEATYTAVGGIGAYGTYQELANAQWLFFPRPPFAAALAISATAGQLTVLKSSLSVVGLDVANKSYCLITPPSDCEDYGDAPSGWGAVDRIVLYTNTKATTANITQATIVRIFTPN